MASNLATHNGFTGNYWSTSGTLPLLSLEQGCHSRRDIRTTSHSGAPIHPVAVNKDRIKRSVALPVCAYLLLIRLYGHDESLSSPWSLFRLKQRFMVDMANAQYHRIETKWQRKLLKLKKAA
jgi:hypothetical protein